MPYIGHGLYYEKIKKKKKKLKLTDKSNRTEQKRKTENQARFWDKITRIVTAMDPQRLGGPTLSFCNGGQRRRSTVSCGEIHRHPHLGSSLLY